MRFPLHVLSIGVRERLDMAQCAYLLGQDCELVAAGDFREFHTLAMQEGCEIAVLGDALSSKELTEAAQLIRRRWPLAAILVICGEPSSIEDALYDDRVPPGSSRATIIAEVSRVAANRRVLAGGGAKTWEC